MDGSRSGTLAGLRLALNTQTPLLRADAREATDAPDALRLPALRRHDRRTTGGVTRMLLPLVDEWLRDGTAERVEWVALSACDDLPIVGDDALRFSFVALPPERRAQYAATKEAVWRALNSLPGDAPASWGAFDEYQRRCAAALNDAEERLGGADVLYVHDFQQMDVARHLRGPRRPRVFHLHTPFPRAAPPSVSSRVVAALSAYDAVVVSTRRYAENLAAAGLGTPVCVVPPFVDPSDFRGAGASEQAAFRDAHGIGRHERVVLNVGRMDPMKGQDRLIRAMPRLLRVVPDARLLLVGNGSFSSSRRGGLGLSKGAQWRAALEALARRLGLSERVAFAGHVDEAALGAAYATSDVFCLPSPREGFGLAAVEAWLHGKPIVVSNRAGVADLVEQGVSGFAIDCGDPELLSRALVELLRDPAKAQEAGRRGREASLAATLPQGRRALERVLASVLDGRGEVARVAA